MVNQSIKKTHIAENQIWWHSSVGKEYRVRQNTLTILSTPIDEAMGVDFITVRPEDLVSRNGWILRHTPEHQPYHLSVTSAGNTYSILGRNVVQISVEKGYLDYDGMFLLHPPYEPLMCATLDVSSFRAAYGRLNKRLFSLTKEEWDTLEFIPFSFDATIRRDRLWRSRVIDEVVRIMLKKASIPAHKVMMPNLDHASEIVCRLGFRPSLKKKDFYDMKYG